MVKARILLRIVIINNRFNTVPEMVKRLYILDAYIDDISNIKIIERF